jgi:chromate transporter
LHRRGGGRSSDAGNSAGDRSAVANGSARGSLTLAQLFIVFFRAGCAFGGGLAVLGILEEELVRKRQLLSRSDLLTLWSIGRIVPCGTMTAVTVALGYRFCGHRGVFAGLIAVILPGFMCTVALTAAYGVLAHGVVLDYIAATLLPAALAFIVVSAFRLGREIFHPSLELLLAAATFVAAVVLHWNPALLMIIGAALGAVALRRPDDATR